MKISQRLTNIRRNHLHQVTCAIIKRKPSFICMEDLNVKGMMKNRHLSKAVQQQCFREFRRQIEYKARWNHIAVIFADRFFPSSKQCCCCGKIKKDLKLSERIYRCDCGNRIDRDYQAALNLKRYGERIFRQGTAVWHSWLLKRSTDSLVRNLRLWSVPELVSSICFFAV